MKIKTLIYTTRSQGLNSFMFFFSIFIHKNNKHFFSFYFSSPIFVISFFFLLISFTGKRLSTYFRQGKLHTSKKEKENTSA